MTGTSSRVRLSGRPPLLTLPGRVAAWAGAAAAGASLAAALLMAASAERLAWTWNAGFAQEASLAAPDEATYAAAVEVLRSSPGVAEVTRLDGDPPLAAIRIDRGGSLAEDGVALRLAAEAPGAVLDLHEAWRGPLRRAALGLRAAGWVIAALLATAALGLLAQATRLRAVAGLSEDAPLLVSMGVPPERIAAFAARTEGLRAAFGAFWGATGVALGAWAAAGLWPAAVLPGEPVVAALTAAAAASTSGVAAWVARRAARDAVEPSDPWRAAAGGAPRASTEPAA